MPKFKLRGAAIAIAAIGMLGSLTSPAGAATDGPSSVGTPGVYAYPASTPDYTQLQFYTKVTEDPTPGLDNGANVFWSHQFSSTTDNSGGYIGFQTPKRANGGRQVLFSVWGATGCQLGDANYEPVCVNNTDGDPGAGARIFYPWVAGVKYRFTVKQAPSQPGWWVAYLYDPSKNQNLRIGFLQFGGPTTGKIRPEVDWVEYYNWNDPNAICGDQINSSAVFYPITGTDGNATVPPVSYTSTSNNDCDYADLGSILSDGSASIVAKPQGATNPPPTTTTLTTTTSSVANGSSLTFSYTTPLSSSSSKNWIGIYKQGQTPGSQYSTDWKTAGGDRGSVTFTANYGPGTYQVYFLYNDTYQVLAGPITVTLT